MIKFIKPSDPRVFGADREDWVRDYLQILSIEQIDNDASAYFVMGFRNTHSEDSRNFRMIVKVKNFFREHFQNYDDAMLLINQVKDKNYGK